VSDTPFGGLPFFGDLAKMLGQQGPLNWDAARQLAYAVATEGSSEVNVDPLERMSYEALARVADLHVGEVTGLSTAITGRGVSIATVTPGGWVARSLDAYKPLFDALALALGSATTPAADPEPSDDPTAALMDGLMRMLTPSMLGLSAGSMVGHLATRSFGQYDLPIPRPPSDELLVVPSAVRRFADDWSLPLDDLRLFVCVHEIAHHAILGVPHVRATLESLLVEFARAFRPDARALEDRLGELDLENPDALAGLQKALADPEVMLGAMATPEQHQVQRRLDALVAVIVGVVDHVLDTIGSRLISSYGGLSEAMRRERVTPHQSDVFVQRLLGLSLGREQVERGCDFVSGVIERAGEDGLARLWRSQRELPTAAEVDAPGLWLARIDIAD
jgi:putative hydrolase